MGLSSLFSISQRLKIFAVYPSSKVKNTKSPENEHKVNKKEIVSKSVQAKNQSYLNMLLYLYCLISNPLSKATKLPLHFSLQLGLTLFF